MDPNRAWIGFMASGMITAGFGIRAVRVSMLDVLHCRERLIR
jgi:hypothetical protein